MGVASTRKAIYVNHQHDLRGKSIGKNISKIIATPRKPLYYHWKDNCHLKINASRHASEVAYTCLWVPALGFVLELLIAIFSCIAIGSLVQPLASTDRYAPCEASSEVDSDYRDLKIFEVLALGQGSWGGQVFSPSLGGTSSSTTPHAKGAGGNTWFCMKGYTGHLRPINWEAFESRVNTPGTCCKMLCFKRLGIFTLHFPLGEFSPESVRCLKGDGGADLCAEARSNMWIICVEVEVHCFHGTPSSAQVCPGVNDLLPALGCFWSKDCWNPHSLVQALLTIQSSHNLLRS